MPKRVQDVAPPRPEENRKWVKENIAEQKKRHKAIQKEINVDLAPQLKRETIKDFIQATHGSHEEISIQKEVEVLKVPVPSYDIMVKMTECLTFSLSSLSQERRLVNEMW